MDFIDTLKSFASRAEKLKGQILTEEATKTSLVMPFFQQVFGYDIFNPDEFVPEFTADVGIKKGEKVDYAIFIDSKPTILIEVKWCGSALDKHDSQLFRYFGTTNAKFAILTNGLIYKFYTDLEEHNKMDLTPFLEFDLEDIKDSLVPEIKRFCKSNFDLEEIFGKASELKYSSEIKSYFSMQLKDPDDEFVKFFMSPTFAGMKTQNAINKFKPIIKSSLNEYINELMNERITSALRADNPGHGYSSDEVAATMDNDLDDDKDPRIVTTEEEMEAFYIIKAILSERFEATKITHKDTVSYFTVLYDNNTWKWICRLRLGKNKSSISFQGDNRQEVKYDIESVNDLFKYKDMFIETVSKIVGDLSKSSVSDSAESNP